MHDFYAPPRAHDAPVHAVSHAGLQDASLGRRFGGAFIDGAFIGFVGMFVSATSAKVLGVERTLNWAYASMMVPHALVWFLVATRGQSLGKILMKTRIVRMDGSACGFVHGVVMRAWPLLLPGLFARLASLDPKGPVTTVSSAMALIDVAFIFSAGARCLHDRIAGTRVVDLRAIDPDERTPILRMRAGSR